MTAAAAGTVAPAARADPGGCAPDDPGGARLVVRIHDTAGQRTCYLPWQTATDASDITASAYRVRYANGTVDPGADIPSGAVSVDAVLRLTVGSVDLVRSTEVSAPNVDGGSPLSAATHDFTDPSSAFTETQPFFYNRGGDEIGYGRPQRTGLDADVNGSDARYYPPLFLDVHVDGEPLRPVLRASARSVPDQGQVCFAVGGVDPAAAYANRFDFGDDATGNSTGGEAVCHRYHVTPPATVAIYRASVAVSGPQASGVSDPVDVRVGSGTPSSAPNQMPGSGTASSSQPRRGPVTGRGRTPAAGATADGRSGGVAGADSAGGPGGGSSAGASDLAGGAAAGDSAAARAASPGDGPGATTRSAGASPAEAVAGLLLTGGRAAAAVAPGARTSNPAPARAARTASTPVRAGTVAAGVFVVLALLVGGAAAERRRGAGRRR